MKRHVLLQVLLFVMCVGSALTSLAQERTLTGTVTDEKGATLPGATITVKGSSIATRTESNGRFSLNVPAATKTIIVSFIGMESQEYNLSKKNTVDISLKSVATTLGDVVVVGYGSIRRKDATGALSSLKREDLIRDAPTNILSAMQGKVAGVNVTQNDGAPGAALSIRVRGSNSFLGGTEPLYVIDGVPFNNTSSGSTPQSIGGDEKQTNNALAFLNPTDIESIDILKDASATAIYGSRGANGVVLITTRRGRTGKDRAELIANVGMSQISRKIHMLNAFDYATYQNLSFTNANLYDGATYTQDNFPYPGKVVPGPTGDYYARGPNDYIDLTRDWQDEIFRTGIYQNYSVNVSGGNEAGSHSLSFNYLNQDGTIVNSAYTRYGLNLNLNRSLGKIFKVGTSTSFANSTTNGVKTGTDKSDDANAGVIRSALTYPSTIDSIGAFNLNGGQGYFITNPSIYARDVLNRVKGLNIFSSNYVEAVITKNFKFRQNLGFNYASNTRDQYYPRTVYEGFSAKGWGLKADDVWNSLVSESMINYAGKLKKHSLNALVASTYEKTNGQWKRVEAKTFPNDLLKNENLEAGEQKMPVLSNRYQSTLISFLGRVNYSFDDKYLLTVSYRQDGSSKFGRDNKWAGFPSMAIAWKVVNEDFMKSFKAINDLKLRVSYGQTGNQGIGSYSSLSKLKVYNYPFNGALQTGLADDVYAGPANDKLKWETTDAYNAGLDLGMFNNRLVVHADVYLKKTNDLLQFVTTPPSTGYPQKLINSGSVENKGVEFSVEGVIVRGHDFEWNSNFNISFNRNKILSLGPDVKEQYAGNISTGDAPFIQKVGHPIGAIYGWVEDGYYDNEAEVRSDPFYATQPDAIIRRTVGEIKYKNLDGKTELTNDDRTFIGNVNPDYTFGFTNIFRYKNFDLNVFVNGVQGNDIINMNTRFNSNLGDNKNITQAQYEHAWTTDADNTNATGPKVIRQFWRGLKFSRRFIEDGSFVRIKNITLGYNIKTKLAGISSLRVSVGVNNLYTFTKYTGYDPEINSYGDNPALYGVDLGGYPNSRAYNFTLRCSF